MIETATPRGSERGSHTQSIAQPIMFSCLSAWEDKQWELRNNTPGASIGASKIFWDFDIDDGSNFLGAEWDNIRNDCKHLVWSLFHDRRVGQHLKPGTLGQVSTGIRILVRAMARYGINSFQGVTPEFVDEMLYDRAETIIDEIGEQGLREGKFAKVVQVCAYLWEQSTALSEAQVAVPDQCPLRGIRAQAVAKRSSIIARGQIAALADGDALAILNNSWRMITDYALDIQVLQDIWTSKLVQPGDYDTQENATKAIRKQKIYHRFSNFKFSSFGDDPGPWHPPLDTIVRDSHKQTGIHITPTGQIRRMVLDVSAAAQIVIQATTGMRTSEICGIQNGWRDDIPSCIEIEPSIDGMLDLFYISSHVSKCEDNPRKTRWVVGCRPAGSSYLPAPVVALKAVMKLFEPWYELSGVTTVFISFGNRRSLPRKGSSIASISGTQVAALQKDFIIKYVNGGSAHSGPIEIDKYRPHRWRKTFAFYIFRTDSSLLRALSVHFKHLSVAMTEQGYIGTDQFLIEDIKNARQQLANHFFSEVVRGSRSIYGPFRKHIESLSSTADFGDTELLITKLEEHEIRVNYSPHGKCLISLFPEQARCNEIMGTNSWSNTTPNFSVREPNICLGCKCFAIDHEHRAYWEQRVLDSEAAYQQLADTEPNAAQVQYERAKTAKAIVKAINRQSEESA